MASRQIPLVGRDGELETFERLWVDVERGSRQVVLLGGEPGVGKTRLVAEVAGALYDNDVTVLVGTSSVDAGVPYQPFTEMLDHLFASAPPGSLSHLLDDHARELQRLSTRVDRHWSDPEAGEAVGDARRDLFDAVAELFRALAQERPLAVVLDDLHWAQAPTLALLEHVIHTSPTSGMLIVATFRTTAPDRSDELTRRLAELHRLDGVRRLDLSGLDTDAIAQYVSIHSGLSVKAARTPAAILRDNTGGNPFFLREVWTDLERRGGVEALRSRRPVPASISDTLAGRLAGLDNEVRELIELAAVLGDSFDLGTLVAASESDDHPAISVVDSAVAAGLIYELERVDGYAFVHSLARQAVLDRLPPSRRIELHARAAIALERQPAHASLVPRLANHYLAAQVLGYHEPALRYTTQAGRLAERGLVFEEAAEWFERAAALPECDPAVRADLLFDAAANWVKAGHFPLARAIYERLATTAEPALRLDAAMGYEDTNWRPGRPDTRAADLLTSALEEYGADDHDPRYVRALASLGRALTFAGEMNRGREVGAKAIDLARQLGDDTVIAQALATSLWNGLPPNMSDLQLERARQLSTIAKRSADDESLGQAVNFQAMASYLRGRPEDLEEAATDVRRVAQATGQPYYQHISQCIAQAQAFMRGDFTAAERWASATLELNGTFGDDMTEGPHGVQMFMIHRETGGLDRFRTFIDGTETFEGRWVPGLLALYTELRVDAGVRRALAHLTRHELRSRTGEGQWPMELVFLTEGALALADAQLLRQLRPLLAEYEGMNLTSGALIAVFGSVDRYLARTAAFFGDHDAAERHFATALEMDRRMHSVVHITETQAHYALYIAGLGQIEPARRVARTAREAAQRCGQRRVLDLLARLPGGDAPDGLTAREIEVSKLLVRGLSNREIGEQLHISTNTAANHIRSILIKTGAANRTQAAMYATQHELA